MKITPSNPLTSPLGRFGSLALCVALLSACGSSSSALDDPDAGSSSSSSESSESSSAESSQSSSASSQAEGDGTQDSLYVQADFPVGVAVQVANWEPFSLFTAPDAADRQALVARHFSEVTATNVMKMSYMRTNSGGFTDAPARPLVDFARANGIKVHGHALVWHADYQVPNVFRDYEGDDWQGLLTEHVEGVMALFDDTVVSWDVVNEAVQTNSSDGWRRSIFYNFAPPEAGQVPEYIEVAYQAARAANPDVDLYYNDFDNTANTARLNKTLEIADRLKELEVIDGIGFQMHAYMDYPSIAQFRNAFQEVVDRDLKVKVTELDIAIVNPYGSSTPPPLPEFDQALADAQGVRFCQIAEAYLDVVPAELRGGFTVWGLTDDDSWLMGAFASATGAQYDQVYPVLFDDNLQAKPAFFGVKRALRGEPCE
ncbi:endo-1,4-beta-xylanase [Marinimicrobium alkaliphilum]|uniref:endo-1,4-beta-xylanase n=1 Tax=Marinimicrobium alkaliphilum TaxID=2202654 RepID=UPI000DBAC057|nr:endo-1,4-beta-xylanase [Marinimicrobium alkaliphilum]